MKNIDGAYFYLSVLFLFKLAVGGILLITSWDALSLSDDSLLNICLLMALSFFPATFSRTVFKKLKKFSLKQQVRINFTTTFVLLGLEYFFLVAKSPIVFIVNFLLWISIFLIEIVFEKWFVGLSHLFSINEARRLSGISTTVGQIGLIIGPLLMILIKPFSASLPYIFCMVILLIPATISLFLNINFQNENEKNGRELKNNPSIIYTIALSLIWPTIVIFNITAPLLAKNQFDSINIAAIMEFLIALAMAAIGFCHILTIDYMSHFKRIIYVSIILFCSATSIFLFPNSLKIIFISTFFIGLSFGYLRIELRAFLSQKFSSEDAGEIVARANSWSGPLVLIYCLLYYFDSTLRSYHQISIVFPLSFIVGASIISFLLISDTEAMKENV
ncbi:MFS transporter [Legionella jamestowniensis]|uniref:Major Facilitator Superfamily protein n=1 Tax=Legionella jamestowniensis TaxID=455 RepID=A0A0W0UZE1_9GAMM|nr:MFS transporter [Legionella jamestowniensis]KTD13215.1 hypothetical protein Ljam_0005 [Legionella jamestowniensis]SFL78594.1 Major Facilitator Superfamily protein [Legionella jamestowniensis DSM 19215]